MFLRSPILAGIFSMLLTYLLAIWCALMLFWHVNWLWSILPIPAALLLATRLHTADWLLDRNGPRTWFRPGLALLIPAVALSIAVPLYRIYQVPVLCPDFSFKEYQGTATPQEKATIDLYLRALAKYNFAKDQKDDAARQKAIASIVKASHQKLAPSIEGMPSLEMVFRTLLSDADDAERAGNLDCCARSVSSGDPSHRANPPMRLGGMGVAEGRCLRGRCVQAPGLMGSPPETDARTNHGGRAAASRSDPANCACRRGQDAIRRSKPHSRWRYERDQLRRRTRVGPDANADDALAALALGAYTARRLLNLQTLWNLESDSAIDHPIAMDIAVFRRLQPAQADFGALAKFGIAHFVAQPDSHGADFERLARQRALARRTYALGKLPGRRDCTAGRAFDLGPRCLEVEARLVAEIARRIGGPVSATRFRSTPIPGTVFSTSATA